MNERNIQNDFLNLLKDEGRRVTVITVNGFQLKGNILGHDRYTIQMDVDGQPHLVYKHAVSTIVRKEG